MQVFVFKCLFSFFVEFIEKMLGLNPWMYKVLLMTVNHSGTGDAAVP